MPIRRKRTVARGAGTVASLLEAVERISPLRLAAEWDNVGLLIGDPRSPVRKVVLTIDLTEAVIGDAAATRGSETAVIAYHPPIFEPLRRVAGPDPRGALILRAARSLAAVISPHTALDAVADGVTDWLSLGVGEGALLPIEAAESLPSGESRMVVTKAPSAAVDRIRDAMSLAGAGRIGEYSRCAFEVRGTGSFEGDATSNPRVGSRERFERVEESKLEMVSSAAALPGVIAALRAAHPYEEPPIEIFSLAARPSLREGHGRVLEMTTARTTDEIGMRLARHLRVAPAAIEVIRADRPGDHRRLRLGTRSKSARANRLEHRRVGLCPGSGGSLVPRAIDLGCTLFVTGEMKHHERLEAVARGCDVILAGHTETERGFLPHYRTRLQRLAPGLAVSVAPRDAPPASRLR